MIPGLDIHLYSKKFRSRLRLENFTSSKTRLFQHFVCYMCVTKEHIILSYKSLFVSFWAIPHITSIPIRLYYTPTPVYISFILLFSHALFYDIIIMLSNRYPATGGGERYKHFNTFCLWQLYHMHFLFAIYAIYFFNVFLLLIRKAPENQGFPRF